MKFANLLRSLGPGLLWAAAAIGVSHLVQSTRAGAMFGFQLVGMVFLINLFKYPFFEFGPRYAASTGMSLLDGYRSLGKWAVYLYLALTFLSMFVLQAAVTMVTGGLFDFVFESPFLNIYHWTIILLIVSGIIVLIGRYSVLDKLIKVIIVLLTISTIVAVFAVAGRGFHPDPEFTRQFNWEFSDIAFLIAFAGWMPTAIDISVWHSFWTLARAKESGRKTSLKESLFDFNVGYVGTAVLSLGFLSLGAYLMYGTGETFSSNGTEFAGQLINLYTTAIGSWAFVIIAVAALTTMFSTTLTCLDAYPRVLRPATELVFPKLKSDKQTNWQNYFWLALLIVGAFVLIRYFASSMKYLVDFATTLSFLTAPVLGYLNYKVVTGKDVSPENRPKVWLRVLSWIGLFILTAFSVYYIVWRYIMPVG